MKKWLIAALAVFLIGIGALLPLTRPVPSRITHANFDRIKPGMSLNEVEDILGPPGDYKTLPEKCGKLRRKYQPGPAPHPPGAPDRPRPRPWDYKMWEGDCGDIVVYFVEGGEVYEAVFWEHDPPGPLDRLGWRWDRWRESVFK